MIVELKMDISNRWWLELKMHEPKNTLARAGYILRYHQKESVENWDRAHAFREARGEILWFSIPGKFFLRRTKLQAFCDEHHMQCYG